MRFLISDISINEKHLGKTYEQLTEQTHRVKLGPIFTDNGIAITLEDKLQSVV